MQLSKSLGNTKPAIVVKIERLLWQTLLEIATGKAPVYKAMTTFFSTLDWDEVAMVSEVDRAHFADGRYWPKQKMNDAEEVTDQSLPHVNFHLVSFEGESALPDLWLLAKLRPKNKEPSPGPSGEFIQELHLWKS